MLWSYDIDRVYIVPDAKNKEEEFMPRGREKDRDLRKKHRKNKDRLKALERDQRTKKAK
ncbi:MAG: hypothetical protein NPIRA01_24700 [Nitrospirales bacterium]|nr:MAG: hypothetical protein NPIRA01_24700 [Nitrospirales bacterium]